MNTEAPTIAAGLDLSEAPTEVLDLRRKAPDTLPSGLYMPGAGRRVATRAASPRVVMIRGSVLRSALAGLGLALGTGVLSWQAATHLSVVPAVPPVMASPVAPPHSNPPTTFETTAVRTKEHTRPPKHVPTKDSLRT